MEARPFKLRQHEKVNGENTRYSLQDIKPYKMPLKRRKLLQSQKNKAK